MSTSVNKAVSDLSPAKELNDSDLFLVSQYDEGFYESRNTSLQVLHGNVYTHVTSTMSIDLDQLLSTGSRVVIKLSNDLYDLSALLLRDYAVSSKIYDVLSAQNTDIGYNLNDNVIELKCGGRRLGSGMDATPYRVSCDGDSIRSNYNRYSNNSELYVSDEWLSTKCLIKGSMAQSNPVDKDMEIESINIDQDGEMSIQLRNKQLSVMGGGGVLDGAIISSFQYKITENSESIEHVVRNDCYIGVELSIHGNTNDSARTNIYLLKQKDDGTYDGECFLNSIDAQQVFDNIEYINYQVPGFPVTMNTKIRIRREDGSKFPYNINYPSSITFREYKLKGCLTEDNLSAFIRKDQYNFVKSISAEGNHYNEVITKISMTQSEGGKYIEQKKLSNATTTKDGLMSYGDKQKLDGIAANANNYTLPTANSNKLGGIKTGYNNGQPKEKNYPVKLDDNDKAYVNVPWTINALIPRPSSQFWIGQFTDNNRGPFDIKKDCFIVCYMNSTSGQAGVTYQMTDAGASVFYDIIHQHPTDGTWATHSFSFMAKSGSRIRIVKNDIESQTIPNITVYGWELY